jgi:hypothetical protein
MVIEGEFKDGEFKEQKATYPDGKVYNGEWLEGTPHGMGVITWPDGRKYIG